MNLNRMIKKLQTAILQKGVIVKVDTYQFHSKEQNRLITKYKVSTPVYSPEKEKMIDLELLSTCSTVDVVCCLRDMYKAVDEWA